MRGKFSHCEIKPEIGDEFESKVPFEMSVNIRRIPRDCELYCIQYPRWKLKLLLNEGVKTRQKRNVKMLEIRLSVDTLSASFDKAAHLASLCCGSNKVTSGSGHLNSLEEQLQMGPCFNNQKSAHHASGFFKCFQMPQYPALEWNV